VHQSVSPCRGFRAIRCGILAAAALLPIASAHAQVRVVNWNIASMKGDPLAIRTAINLMASDAKPGFATAPAIIVFSEVMADDINALETQVDMAIPGINYTRGTFTTTPSEDAAGGAQAVFYRNSVVTEIPALHIDLDTGAGRKSDRWQFQLVGYTSDQAKFFVYASHLKASPGATNESDRLAGAQVVRNNADALAASTHIIYCGDFNLYSNAEPAYAEFLSAGNGQGFDPLGSGSWAGAGNAFKHTQSPRDIAAGGLIGGGMDDRFDFQLSSGEMQDGDGISIVPGSYRAFGNDGNHYNLAINIGNNTYYPSDIPLSNFLADTLFDAADHIPVIVDYRVPGVLSASMSPSFGRVIQNATVSVPVLVQNVAAGHPLGIDSLEVQVVGSGVLSGSSVAGAPIAPSFGVVQVPLATAFVGFGSGSVVVTALSQAAQNTIVNLPTSGQIVRRSNASFSAEEDTDATIVEVSVPKGSGSVAIEVPIHNFGFNALQALLDVDLVSGLGDGFALVGGLEMDIGAVPATLQLTFDASGKPAGVYDRELTVGVSDEDIPGSLSSQLALTVVVTIEAGGNPADLDGDGTVSGADLAVLLGQWGGPGTADFDDNGTVDGADLAVLLGAWNG
jgi:hypothetical protein